MKMDITKQMNSQILNAVLLLVSTKSEILLLNDVQKTFFFQDLELAQSDNGRFTLQFH